MPKTKNEKRKEVRFQNLYECYLKACKELVDLRNEQRRGIINLNGKPMFESLVGLFAKIKARYRTPPLRAETLRKMIADGLHLATIEDAVDEKPYFDWERSFILGSKGNRVWAYLHQFAISEDIIKLEGPLYIRRATILEKYYFQEQNLSHGSSVAEFIIESKPDTKFPIIKVDQTKDEKRILRKFPIPEEPPFGDEFQELVTVIRLTCPTSVGFTTVIFDIDLDEMVFAPIYSPRPSAFPAMYGRLSDFTCGLDEPRVEYLQKIWSRFLRAKKEVSSRRMKRIMRALRRFNNAITSVEMEDEIVELIICLEILFQTGGFKMVFFASHLLGLDEHQYGHAMDTIEEARKVRNKVVHGSSLKKEDRQVIADLQRLTAYTLVYWLALSGVKGGVLSLIKRATCNANLLKRVHSTLKKWTPMYEA